MKEIEYDLSMKNISKSFPGVKALNEVNFHASLGKAVAIVGANGAGKSTLMKVLTGVYDNYEGEIYLEGKLLKMYSPITSKSNGINCVYQEVDTSLVPYLSVAENVLIDKRAMGKKNTCKNWKKINETAKKIFDEMDIKINEKALISELTLSEKQMVLIARAISMESKFLILDEPTAPLSISEIEKLFEILNKLKAKGVGIIYISHRLNEVLEITDEIVVMRNGEVTANLITKDVDRNEIIKKMVGQNFLNEYPKEDVEIGEEVLRVENIKYSNKINNVSFSLREGEILGVAGLVGAGKTELAKAIFGAIKMDEGKIYIKNILCNVNSPSNAVKNKIALVPEERRKEGIMVDENVKSNLTIASMNEFTKNSFILNKKEENISERTVEDLSIKTPSIKQLVRNLSGGNQQKVAVGKWLINDANIYILDEPTKGVDVGSKTEIFKLVGGLVKNKKSVIYMSNEIEEIEGLADRVLILYDGKITKELERKDVTLEKLLFYSTGGVDNAKA